MQKNQLKDIGEFKLISRIANRVTPQKNILKGIGDDAAVITAQKDSKLLLTTDMLAEGVHFTRSMGAKKIGYKAMACSVSDIAAMAGTPLCAVVSLGAPKNLPIQYMDELYKGMNSVSKKFNFSIVGGDTIKNQKIIINVALLGVANSHQVVLRSGAKAGDRIFVTGPLGKSLKTGKHLSFVPRLKEAHYLIKSFKINSMIDISDGLAGDLGHILEESRVGAVLYEKFIPKNKKATLNEAFYDGEDFELLFTLPSMEANKLFRTKTPFKLYYIGDIVGKEEGLTLLDLKGKRKSISIKGFTHF